MPLFVLANPSVSLLPVCLVALAVVGMAIFWRLWASHRNGQGRRFRWLSFAAVLIGPALAMAYLAIDVRFGGYLIWADVPELLLPMLLIGLVAGALVGGMLWLLGY
ncbi:MAG: hypothetical protein H0T51_12140 [Pirellulales bacterium]|nr:hypothetical protein [Pirellulales bacterium]